MTEAPRKACRTILRRELEYLSPKCVIANGVRPSEMLWHLVRPMGAPLHPDRPFVYLPDLNCSVHFSGFLTGMNLDRFARMRLLAEIKDHSPVWNANH